MCSPLINSLPFRRPPAIPPPPFTFSRDNSRPLIWPGYILNETVLINEPGAFSFPSFSLNTYRAQLSTSGGKRQTKSDMRQPSLFKERREPNSRSTHYESWISFGTSTPFAFGPKLGVCVCVVPLRVCSNSFSWLVRPF